MGSFPLVSVIIPTYRRAGMLAEALESVRAQGYPNLDVIVVDDGSRDSTAEVVALHGEWVRYLEQPNRGASAARNRGIREARGEFIAFLDDDDLWRPGKLKEQLRFFKLRPEAAINICGAQFIDERHRVIGERIPPEVMPLDLLEIGVPPGAICSGTLVKRECLEAVGGFDETLFGCEDREWLLRVAQHHPLHCLPAPLVWMRVHGGPRSYRAERNVLACHRRVIEAYITEGRQRRRAHAHLRHYLACLALESGQRLRALRHLACSYLLYPRKIWPGSNRGRNLVSCLVPCRARRLFRHLRGD